MVNHFIAEFKGKHMKDIRENKRAVYHLCTACEHVTCDLISNTQASAEIDSHYKGINFYSSITLAQFEELNAYLSHGTLKPVLKVLQDAKPDKSQIHDTVLVSSFICNPTSQKLA